MNKISLIPFLLCTTPLSSHAQKIQQPHIVLILCDDMGFSDLGCYGSEIHTPNIDKLAQDGIRFSQFKNTQNLWKRRIKRDKCLRNACQ